MASGVTPSGPASRSPGPPPHRAGLPRTVIVLLVAVGVALSASLAYALSVRNIVIVWIPSGVLLGILLSVPSRRWPAVLAGGYLGNLAADLLYVPSPALAALAPVANLVEALLAASIVRRLAGPGNPLASLRGVAVLVFGAAVIGNAVTAVLGGALLDAWYAMSFRAAWLNWWVGDGLGMIIVTPMVLALERGLAGLRLRGIPPAARLAEGAGLAVTLGAVLLLAFNRPPGDSQFLAVTYLIFLLLIWIALRFGPGSAAAAVGLVAVAALLATDHRLGPLAAAAQSRVDLTLHLYAFLALASVSVLVPAAVIAERRDAAERVRSSEERYRALVDTARDAIVSIDLDGRIRFCNPAVHDILGYRPADLAGRSAWELVPDDQRGRVTELIEGYLAAEPRQAVRGIELTARHRDGRGIPIEFLFAEWSADGERFYTGIIRDVSERRRMEEDLRHAQKLEALGQLTGGLAHEFRNELTVILANAELALLEIAPDSPQQPALEEIRGAASRGSALTKELLAFGRRQALQPVRLDLDLLVQRSVATMQPVIGRTIRIEARDGHGRKSVFADPTALQQVLLNLVLNARDAMPDGGQITIHTGLVVADPALAESLSLIEGSPYVTLDLEDDGHGMDGDTVARVFEPFFTTKPKGTGLGLAAVYGIVRQSGGAIRVESAPGAGTTFRIYLPEAPEPGPSRPAG